MAKSRTTANSKTKSRPAAKRSRKQTKPNNGAAGSATSQPTEASAKEPRRLLPAKEELKLLYQRYTENSTFDDHDKAFYFVLDVGGLSRARQLLAHVEEVLAELEEFQH
jgi:hypothetical protein